MSDIVKLPRLARNHQFGDPLPCIPDGHEKRLQHLKSLRSFVILRYSFGKPNVNGVEAIVEHSFAMGEHTNNVNVWWTGEGTDNIVGRKWKVDGESEAREYANKLNVILPESQKWQVYELLEDSCPIEIDWNVYTYANAPADTLSGVNDKFLARNPPFKMKD